MIDQTNKEFEHYYAKRLSWYPLTKTLNHPTRPDGEYLYDSTKAHWETWCECQKLNDARITSLESHNRELLAVIAAKDEALQEVINVFETPDHPGICDTVWVTGNRPETLYDCARDALAIKPGDIALIEVADNDCGSIRWTNEKWPHKCKLYALQKKEG